MANFMTKRFRSSIIQDLRIITRSFKSVTGKRKDPPLTFSESVYKISGFARIYVFH